MNVIYITLPQLAQIVANLLDKKKIVAIKYLRSIVGEQISLLQGGSLLWSKNVLDKFAEDLDKLDLADLIFNPEASLIGQVCSDLEEAAWEATTKITRTKLDEINSEPRTARKLKLMRYTANLPHAICVLDANDDNNKEQI